MTTNLADTIAALRSRQEQFPAELEALRKRRGPAALVATTTGKADELDAIDRDIAVLQRTQGDIVAALEEARWQQIEAKDRARIDDAKAAIKEIPAVEKKVRAAYEDVAKAVGALGAALAKARQVEGVANDTAHRAAPFLDGCGDVYTAGSRTFHMTRAVPAMVERVCAPNADPARSQVADQFSEHVGVVVRRITAEHERRVQVLEQALHEVRTGKQRDPAVEAVAHQQSLSEQHERLRQQPAHSA